MATPKKKVSRSRRNMRRFAAGNQLDKPTSSLAETAVNPFALTVFADLADITKAKLFFQQKIKL